MRSNQVHIDSPCHESWEAMEGDSERRFCGVCQKHVHNLSAMAHDDAQSLLQAASGEHLCVRYSAEADGSVRFRDLVPRSRLTRGLRRAAFAAVMLAACSPQVDPIADLGQVMIESMQNTVIPTPDGGCNYVTGPFTAFHFPQGHAMCGPADHGAVATITAVAPRMPTFDPFPAAGPPEPAVDPVPPPLMGEAIADPGPIDPFVPCDPKPGFAPPPPPHHPGFAPPPPPHHPGFAPPPPGHTTRFAPPPDPPIERMGDIAPPRHEPPPQIMGGIKVSDPPPHPGFAPPPPPHHPGFAPPPPSHQPGFAPPPPGFAPPPPREPDDDVLMGSISRPAD
jgi:hypothetical protein